MLLLRRKVEDWERHFPQRLNIHNGWLVDPASVKAMPAELQPWKSETQCSKVKKACYSDAHTTLHPH